MEKRFSVRLENPLTLQICEDFVMEGYQNGKAASDTKNLDEGECFSERAPLV